MKKFKTAMLAIPAYVMSLTAAHAEAVDVTALVADITGQKASVGLIGMAILGVVLAIVCFNWIRRSIK